MNDAQRERRLEELFALAVELSRGEREDFLRRHCGSDLPLRAELESLLSQDDEGTKDYLASPVLSQTTGTAPTAPGGLLPPGSVPERVGRYRLVRRLGEGGMGAVYLAEQETPVKRQVALKIVKLGMDTEKVVARFERERQTLALMDHPGIARILDGGSTESGRPYFVMEYVPGLAIHEFADRERLSIRQRLGLFAEVCDAVQHAHQKGVVHRDIKPSNVLVTTRDGRPAPKIIDFGIARAVSTDEAGTRAQTRAHEIVGTRWYMSPEQAADAARVDTRTDVYALGVLLYELLSGVLPFDVESLRKLPPEELRRRIHESGPPLPSARVARLPQADEIARRRGTDRRGLARRLAGDLDWITLKAQAREPALRYPSASELGADVRRHLAHQPVLAGPPDLSYQLRKLVRRHRVVVLSGAGVFLALLVALIATGWAALEVARQRDAEQEHARIASAAEDRARAEHAEAVRAREAERRLRGVAEEEARQASAATAFLVETISLADPEVALSPDVLRALLQHAGEQVATTFADDPHTEALLRRAIGQAWHSLDELALAERHLERALELQDGLDDFPLEELYLTARRLSKVQEDADSREASALGMRACRIATALIGRELPQVGSDLRTQLELAAVLRLEDLDKLDALRGFEALYAELESRLPRGHAFWPLVADVWEFVGYQLGYRVDDPGGLPFLQRALEIRRRELDPRHPDVARTSGRLVHLLDQLERHAEAERLVRERIEIQSRYLAPDSWRLLEARSQLGACLSGQGLHEEGGKLLLESQRTMLAARGAANAAVLDASWRLVRHFERVRDPHNAARFRDQLAEALAFSRNAPGRLDRRLAAFGPEHARLADALAKLERTYEQARAGLAPEDFAASLRAQIERIVHLRRESLADDEPRAALVARLLNRVSLPPGSSLALRRLVVDEVLTALDAHRERLPLDVASAWGELGELARELGRPEEAEAHFRQCWEILVPAEGRCEEATLLAQRRLTRAEIALGRGALARERAEESWCECLETLGPGHDNTIAALTELVHLTELDGRPAACEPFVLAHLDGRIARDRSYARLLNAAWMLVRTPDLPAAVHELARAAAARAAELVPHDDAELANTASVAWTTLGAALLRTGRTVEALDALERARGLGEGLDPRNHALEALGAHALGLEARALEAWACMEDELALLPDDAWGSPYGDTLLVAAEARRRLGVERPPAR